MTKMNNRMMITVFLIAGLSIIAQGQGMVFDQEAFDKGESYEMERSDFIPDAFSLKKYAPYVLRQQLSTCVAYSTATALTMLNAILKNEADTKIISIQMLSPHWIYYRNRDNTDKACKEGLNIDKAMVDLLNYGAPYMLMVEYPDFHPYGEVQLCNYYPPDFEKDLATAVANKPDEIFRVKSTDEIKAVISKGLPVVIGMNVPNSFEMAIGKSLWTPKITETKLDGYGHALVVVGYDDKKHGGSFEILNSWGEAWGNGGYIWVKYSDFKKFFLGGYALYKEKKLRAESPNMSGKEKSVLIDNDIKLSKSSKQKKSKDVNRWKELGGK